MSTALGKWKLLAAIFAIAVIGDQSTKFLAVDRLTTVFQRRGATTIGEKLEGFYSYRYLEPYSTPPYTVFRPVWRMNYVENPGAAWGLFRTMSDDVRNGFFALISIAAVGFILYYYRRLGPHQRYLQVALSLILAGAVGNFIDRLARKYVIDFIEWYWWNRPDIRWPTFNLADSLIVIGVAMLVLHPGSKSQARSSDAEREGNKRAASGL